jgi:putative transposase
MPTYTQIYYHIVFSTKNRRQVLTEDNREELFRYIWGILKNKKCHLYRINAVEDHIHIFTSIHPSCSLADLVRDIKVSSSKMIREKGLFAGFEGWQDNYGAFTNSEADKDQVIEYIKTQEQHHKKISFKEELKKILEESGIEIDEKYFP